MNYSKGSQWKKWDLHVHTPFSIVQHYGENTSPKVWERYIKDLEALPREFAVLGINDYMFLDGYERLQKEKNENNRLKNIDLLLPVIEFRIEKFAGIDFGNLKRINLHVIFSNELTIETIKSQFLNTLEQSYKLAGGSQWTRAITRESLEDLGKQIKATVPTDQPDKYGSNLEEGFNNLNVDEKQIFDSLNKDCFKNKYLIAIGKTEWDSLRWTDASIATKKSIINSADIIFTAAESIEVFVKAKEKLQQQGVKNLLLDCSDGHYYSDQNTVKDRIGNCFTWIKADPTFEGLQQILWDPIQRVNIQERNPSLTKTGRTAIDYIVYKDAEGNEHTVQLNNDLNSIIGIRGSGKSTLLKNIAYVVDQKQFLEKDRIDRLYPLDLFKIVWGDGQQNSGSEESPKSIFYIPQNYLSALSYDDGDKSKERDQFLTKLLKKNIRFANAIQTYEEFVSTGKIKVEGLIQSILTANKFLNEANELLKKQGAKAEIEKEIKGKNEEIKKYKDSGNQVITEEEITKYSGAKKTITENNVELISLNQDKIILSSLQQTGAKILVANQEFSRLSTARQITLRDALIQKGNKDLNQLVQTELTKIDLELKQIQESLIAQAKIVEELDKKIKANKAIGDLAKELGDLQQTLKRIDDLTKIITQSKIQKDGAIEELINIYAEFESQQKSIFGTVKVDEKFLFLKIDTVTVYNTNDLKQFVERNINTRDTETQLKADPEIQDLFGEAPSQPSKELIKKLIENLISGRVKTKVEANDIGQVIAQLLKNRYEIDYLNSVKTKEGAHFKDMTGGQKAIALLELIFKFDDEKYPILIDQPEDDLDVGGIATDLVEFVKYEKAERQIIIVSHNASLVICSDSEEILVSNSQKVRVGKYSFSYQTGAIENPAIREEIIKVLEGGKEALKQRARKLNFKDEI